MRQSLLLALALGLAQNLKAGDNPYVFATARELFYSRQDLKGDPEFSKLLAEADDDSDSRGRDESRRKLTDYALPLGLALGAIDSSGLAPAFFEEQLRRTPADYHGIIARFDEYLSPRPRACVASTRGRQEKRRAVEEFMRAQAGLLTGRPGAPDAFAVNLPALRPEIRHELEFAVAYNQRNYQPVDLQGDVALLAYTKAIPKTLFKVALGLAPVPATPRPFFVSGSGEDLNPIVPVEKASSPDEHQILASDIPLLEKRKKIAQARNAVLVIEGRKDPIRVEEAAKMLTQIIASESAAGIPPRFGEPHAWSREFLTQYAGLPGNFAYTRFSKLLMALSSGVTARFMATDKELPLLTYLLGRPDRSVTLHELFRKSYQLNDGDVYLALLTAENVLSAYWRSPQRENRAVTRKLKPIANHYQDRGNTFGEWYHLLGIMLYGYVSGKPAHVVAYVESLGNNILSRAPAETQENKINRQGAALGVRLREIVRKKKYAGFHEDVGYQDDGKYLDLGEDYRDRITVAENGDFKTSLYDDVLTVWSSEKDYSGCTLELMPDMGEGFDSRRTVVRQNVGFKAGKPTSILIPYIPHPLKGSSSPLGDSPHAPKAIRAFISGCEGGLAAVLSAQNQNAGLQHFH